MASSNESGEEDDCIQVLTSSDTLLTEINGPPSSTVSEENKSEEENHADVGRTESSSGETLPELQPRSVELYNEILSMLAANRFYSTVTRSINSPTDASYDLPINEQNLPRSVRNLDNEMFQQITQYLRSRGKPLAAPESLISSLTNHRIGEDDLNMSPICTICMESFILGDCVFRLNCLHCYHCNCITKWFRINGSCPICRTRASEMQNVDANSGQSNEETAEDSVHISGAYSTHSTRVSETIDVPMQTSNEESDVSELSSNSDEHFAPVSRNFHSHSRQRFSERLSDILHRRFNPYNRGHARNEQS